MKLKGRVIWMGRYFVIIRPASLDGGSYKEMRKYE